MNLVLIGYRGTGKTTVARRLSQRLGWSALDADDEVERRAGRSIADIFAQDGEASFRDLESAVLLDLAGLTHTVFAAGGGAVLREPNRRALRDAGRVVWLTAPAEVLARRIAADATTSARRPNLTAAGGEAEIRQLLAQRAPLYRECAELDVDTAEKSPDEIAREILERLRLDAQPEGA